MDDATRVRRNYWISQVAPGERESILSMGETIASDAFYRDLAFGTGGLRGILGIGSNRMNVYTVAKATQGLANYLNSVHESACVAIARDSRNLGEKFCKVVACVLAANGIKAYMYPRIEPTPALSFAVRYLKCDAGVCITASHNPAEYNGYKVYGSDGCQITTAAACSIQEHIDVVDAFKDVVYADFDYEITAGLIDWIDDSVLDAFIQSIVNQSTKVDCSDLRVVYTPLHGAGLECAKRVFSAIGVRDLIIEPKQAKANGNFPTCPYPNPELPEAMALGLDLCAQTNSDVLLASDPDADRAGVAVMYENECRLLTGNQIGILLTNYLCEKAQAVGKDPHEFIVVTTIVSSRMATDLAMDWGFELRRTLTGFKFIGEQIGLLEEQGRERQFLFGFEESYGFLSGSYVRDKDAMVACMLICEMVSWYKAQGINLLEAMQALYQRYGFYESKLLSFSYPGEQGATEMNMLMSRLEAADDTTVFGRSIVNRIDYSHGVEMPIVNKQSSTHRQRLPLSRVLEFRFSDNSSVIIRPSGTEPKIKAYLSSRAYSQDKALRNIDELAQRVSSVLGNR